MSGTILQVQNKFDITQKSYLTRLFLLWWYHSLMLLNNYSKKLPFCGLYYPICGILKIGKGGVWMSKNHGKLYYDLLDDNLSKSAIVFFTLLLSNSNQKGYAFGSNKYYASKLKCSTRTISALIRVLINKEYITVENPKSFRRKIFIRNKFLT